MDVYCATCGEPWDTYYLRHEVPQECETTEREATEIAKTGQVVPAKRVRDAYLREGWLLAAWRVCAVLHCPCCPENVQTNAKRAEMVKATAEALGGDPDGLESVLSALGEE